MNADSLAPGAEAAPELPRPAAVPGGNPNAAEAPPAADAADAGAPPPDAGADAGVESGPLVGGG